MKTLTKNAFKILALTLALLSMDGIISGAQAQAASYGRVSFFLMRKGMIGNVSVNGGNVGTAIGPDYVTGKVNPLLVARVVQPVPGAGFAIGPNRVQIDTGDTIAKFTVVVPQPVDYPLYQDLVLEVYDHQWVLSMPYGAGDIASGAIEYVDSY